jgi:hypothetical protein
VSDLHDHMLDLAKGHVAALENRDAEGHAWPSSKHMSRERVMLWTARVTVALCVALAAGSAWSHHGFSGRYDLSAPVWIEGEVVSAYLGQPHAELTIRTSANLSVPSPLPDLGTAESFLNAQDLTVRAEAQDATVRVELPPTQQYFGLGNRVNAAQTARHRIWRLIFDHNHRRGMARLNSYLLGRSRGALPAH